MRRYLTWGFLSLLCSSLPATAAAKPPPLTKIPAALLDEMLVFRTGRGRYLVVPNLRFKMENKLRNKMYRLTYYGDAKQVYRVSTTNRLSPQKDGRFGFYLTEKRAYTARFDHDPSGSSLRCDDTRVPLKKLAPRQARAFLGKVALRPPFWQHEPHLLARDDEGRYFYIDRNFTGLQGRRGTAPLEHLRGFRLWIGRRGAVKLVKLRDAVIDEAGQIFLTKRGALHVEKTQKIFWRQGKQRMPLTRVPIWGQTATRLLIYKHLGAYTNVRFHTPCDDL